jgi:D-alanine-D-alanine ligase
MDLAKLKIAVLKGGPSAEREVSLRSGAAVAAALREDGGEVTEVDVRDETFILPEKIDLAFLSLHGTFGEDGQIQNILNTRGIPFTGSGAEASARAFDKAESKKAFTAMHLPTPPAQLLKGGDRLSLPLPVVLKPNCQGSSVGLEFVTADSEIESALGRSRQHGSEILAERRIVGRELTVGILGGSALPVIEIRPKQGAYDYHHKYTAGATEYLCPAPLSSAQTQQVQELAEKAHEALGCEIYSRVDLMWEEATQQPWLLEVNTIPGMTATSLLPKAAAATGLSFRALCRKIVELSWQRVNARQGGA